MESIIITIVVASVSILNIWVLTAVNRNSRSIKSTNEALTLKIDNVITKFNDEIKDIRKDLRNDYVGNSECKSKRELVDEKIKAIREFFELVARQNKLEHNGILDAVNILTSDSKGDREKILKKIDKIDTCVTAIIQGEKC